MVAHDPPSVSIWGYWVFCCGDLFISSTPRFLPGRLGNDRAVGELEVGESYPGLGLLMRGDSDGRCGRAGHEGAWAGVPAQGRRVCAGGLVGVGDGVGGSRVRAIDARRAARV